MSSQAVKVDKDIQKLLDTKGFNFIISEVNKWTINKYEHIRAYNPEEKEDFKMYKTIETLLILILKTYK